MNDDIDILCDQIDSLSISELDKGNLKNRVRNLARGTRGTREDLQDQIDDLQQQVGDLMELFAMSQCPGGNLQVGDIPLAIKSRFYVEFDMPDDERDRGYRESMVVFAVNKWYAENKVRIAYPNAKNFETFLLSKQEP